KAADVTFDEAKQQVVEAWKKQKAFDLALAEAQKLADKAKGAASLKDVVTDPAKVSSPPPFSWMTTGSLGFGFGEPSLGRVPGVESAGNDSMNPVFGRRRGQAGVAPNETHACVYVVRFLSQEPSDEILRQQFLDSGLNFQVLGIAQRDRQQFIFDWY